MYEALSRAGRMPDTMDAAMLRLRIDAFLAEYVHAIDADNLESWPDFFRLVQTK